MLGGGPWTKQIALPNDFVLASAGVPASTIVLNDECRGLLIGVSGTLNVVMATGVVRNGVPVQAGVNPGRFREIRSGGTAENIWQVI